MDYDFVIQTPLMWLDKAETWELADQLGAFDYVRAKTLTCYNGIIGSGCGVPSLPPTSTWVRCLSLTERRGLMFLHPKKSNKKLGSLLSTIPHRTLVSKEFTFDAAHHLFHYEGKCKSLHGHTYHLQIAVSGF